MFENEEGKLTKFVKIQGVKLSPVSRYLSNYSLFNDDHYIMYFLRDFMYLTDSGP